jgi:hypothetical protein
MLKKGDSIICILVVGTYDGVIEVGAMLILGMGDGRALGACDGVLVVGRDVGGADAVLLLDEFVSLTLEEGWDVASDALPKMLLVLPAVRNVSDRSGMVATVGMGEAVIAMDGARVKFSTKPRDGVGVAEAASPSVVAKLAVGDGVGESVALLLISDDLAAGACDKQGRILQTTRHTQTTRSRKGAKGLLRRTLHIDSWLVMRTADIQTARMVSFVVSVS